MPERHGAQLTICPGREPRKQPSTTGGKGRAQPERLSSLRTYSPRQRSWAHSPALLLNSTEAWTGQGAQPVTCALMRQSLKPHRTRELWTETAPTPDAHSPAPPTHGTGREAPPRWEPGQPLHSQRPPGLQSPAVALPNFRVQPVTPREGRPPRPHRSRSNGGAQPIALTFYGVQSAASPWYWIGPATLPDQKGLQSPASGPTWMQNR